MPLGIMTSCKKIFLASFLLVGLGVVFNARLALAQAGLPPGACNGFTASAQAANTANNVAGAQALKRNATLYQNCTRAKQLIDSTRPPPPSAEDRAWPSANSCEAVTRFANTYPRSRRASEAAARKTRLCTPPPNCNEYAAQARAAAARRDLAVLRLLQGQTRNYQACSIARNTINAGLAPSPKTKQKERATEPAPEQVPPPVTIPVTEPPILSTGQTLPTPPAGANSPNTAPIPTLAPTPAPMPTAEAPPVDAVPPVNSQPPATVVTPPAIVALPPAPVWLFRPIGATSEGGTLYYANDFVKAAPVLQGECNGQNWVSCAMLGAIYGDGLGVAVDFDRSFNYSRMSCDNAVMLGCVFLGHRYVQSGNSDESNTRAAELFKQSCDAGEPDGCNALAEAHRTGTGAKRDAELATAAFGRAAQGFRAYCNAGRTSYCGQLGTLYLNGYGVERDETMAQALFRQGCEGKDQPSCYMLGNATRVF